MNNLRLIEVTYSNGAVITTNMSATLTDEEMLEYFAPGKWFNLVDFDEDDNIQQIVESKILK